MGRTILINALSLNMLNGLFTNAGDNIKIEIELCSLDQIKQTLENGFESAIGHADLGNILSEMIGLEIPVNRCSVALEKGDLGVVAQYIGPRLEEGTTSLPEGATIKFFELTVV